MQESLVSTTTAVVGDCLTVGKSRKACIKGQQLTCHRSRLQQHGRNLFSCLARALKQQHFVTVRLRPDEVYTLFPTIPEARVDFSVSIWPGAKD